MYTTLDDALVPADTFGLSTLFWMCGKFGWKWSLQDSYICDGRSPPYFVVIIPPHQLVPITYDVPFKATKSAFRIHPAAEV